MRYDPRFQSLLRRMNFPEKPFALTCLRVGLRMAAKRRYETGRRIYDRGEHN